MGEPPLPGPRHGQGRGTVNTNVVEVAGRTWALVEPGAYPIELTVDLESTGQQPL